METLTIILIFLILILIAVIASKKARRIIKNVVDSTIDFIERLSNAIGFMIMILLFMAIIVGLIALIIWGWGKMHPTETYNYSWSIGRIIGITIIAFIAIGLLELWLKNEARITKYKLLIRESLVLVWVILTVRLLPLFFPDFTISDSITMLTFGYVCYIIFRIINYARFRIKGVSKS